MGRRILNRKDLRADFEAAERRKQEDDEDEVEEDEEESDEGEDDAEAEAGDESEEAEDEDEEEAPPKKKKKAAPAKEAKPKRSRTAKQVRMKVIWGVFNNSNQCVAKFDYPKRKEADDHAAKLAAAKTPPQSFFVQPIKEPIEEKKE